MNPLQLIRKKLGHLTMEWSPSFWLDTGLPDLNEVLGHRDLGIPYGRVTEISGLESAGKTALIMSIAAMAQRQGALIVWLDFEVSFSPAWAIQRGIAPCPKCTGSGLIGKTGCKACGGGGKSFLCKGSGKIGSEICKDCGGLGEKKGLGIDTDRFILIQPYIGQFYEDPKNPKKLGSPRISNAQELCNEATQIMSELHEKFDRKVIVIDSIASMLTEGEEVAGLENAGFRENQALPSFMSKLLKRWVGEMQGFNAMLFLINQLRQNPMQRFGDPWYTPGGNAPRFYSHIRVRVRRAGKGKLIDGGKQVGIKGIMGNRKNKVGGVEYSEIGYKIFFKGAIKFLPAAKLKKEGDE